MSYLFSVEKSINHCPSLIISKEVAFVTHC